MKKQIIAAAMSAVMIFGACAFAAEVENNAEVTAYENLNYADEALKLKIIANEDYSPNDEITRAQFCELTYDTLNPIKEFPAAKLARSPFDDVTNPKINALAFVDIVSGKGEYIFAPDDKITREEAAVILYRAAEYAGLEIPQVKVDITYSDNGEISDWAVSKVYGLKALEIISNGDGEKFNPKANYTVGETLMSLVKLHNLIK